MPGFERLLMLKSQETLAEVKQLSYLSKPFQGQQTNAIKYLTSFSVIQSFQARIYLELNNVETWIILAA